MQNVHAEGAENAAGLGVNVAIDSTHPDEAEAKGKKKKCHGQSGTIYSDHIT
jgi:hypothetical protein